MGKWMQKPDTTKKPITAAIPKATASQAFERVTAHGLAPNAENRGITCRWLITTQKANTKRSLSRAGKWRCRTAAGWVMTNTGGG